MEDFYTFYDLVLVAFISFIFGILFIINRLKSKILANQGVKVSVTKVDLNNIPVLETELYNNIIFLYDTKLKTFQGQANSIDELAKVYITVKKVDIAQVIHNHERVWFINGRVRKSLLDNQ
tara:strand:+ start:122 stop:484 length:363 start_codon:yes stop_codon:yes gene_type:complete